MVETSLVMMCDKVEDKVPRLSSLLTNNTFTNK